MILKVLGLLDLLTAISLFLVKFDIGWNWVIIFPFLILIKAIPFLSDWNSWVDIVAVIIFLLSFYGVFYNILTYLAIVWWLQKGFMSFLG